MRRSIGLPLVASIALTAIGLPALAADAALKERFSAELNKVIDGAEVTSVEPTPIAGVVEVAIGPRILYMTSDARFVVTGDLIDLRQVANLTEQRREKARLAALEAIGTNRMIEFAPKDPKHTIYVFTDVDCSFCRRLHNEVPDLNAAGIAVRYLAFPRSGVDSPSGKKIRSVWCSKNQQQALTDVKNGKAIPAAICDNPVAEHFNLGDLMGVRGTPTIVLDNGELVRGYMPSAELVKVFDDS